MPPFEHKNEPTWDEALQQTCPICERPKGDHTLYEYVECIRLRIQKLETALQ